MKVVLQVEYMDKKFEAHKNSLMTYKKEWEFNLFRKSYYYQMKTLPKTTSP